MPRLGHWVIPTSSILALTLRRSEKILSCPQYTEEISAVVLRFELTGQGANPVNSPTFCDSGW